MSKQNLDDITGAVIGASIAIHKELGPGLLESAYQACLLFELLQLGFKVEQEKPLPIIYKDVRLDCGYRLDLVVEDRVIIEVKSVQEVTDVHRAQLLSYLKLSGCKAGLLINFNVEWLKNGICRMAL